MDRMQLLRDWAVKCHICERGLMLFDRHKDPEEAWSSCTDGEELLWFVAHSALAFDPRLKDLAVRFALDTPNAMGGTVWNSYRHGSGNPILVAKGFLLETSTYSELKEAVYEAYTYVYHSSDPTSIELATGLAAYCSVLGVATRFSGYCAYYSACKAISSMIDPYYVYPNYKKNLPIIENIMRVGTSWQADQVRSKFSFHEVYDAVGKSIKTGQTFSWRMDKPFFECWPTEFQTLRFDYMAKAGIMENLAIVR